MRESSENGENFQRQLTLKENYSFLQKEIS